MIGQQNQNEQNYLKLFLTKENQVHLVILKLLKELGISTKKKRTIVWQLEQDLKTALILLDGI